MNEELQTVLTKIQSILNDTDLDKLIETILQRLVSFGCTPTKDDVFSIAYGIQKVQNHILNVTNQAVVPDGLFELNVDMVCGEVLNGKFLSGQLDLTALDLDGMIQSVKEGDTQVNFSAEGSDETKAQELFRWLMQGKGSDLLCYRKMRW